MAEEMIEGRFADDHPVIVCLGTKQNEAEFGCGWVPFGELNDFVMHELFEDGQLWNYQTDLTDVYCGDPVSIQSAFVCRDGPGRHKNWLLTIHSHAKTTQGIVDDVTTVYPRMTIDLAFEEGLPRHYVRNDDDD